MNDSGFIGTNNWLSQSFVDVDDNIYLFHPQNNDEIKISYGVVIITFM